MAEIAVTEFGAGIYRGRKAPQGSAWDLVNVVVDDEGQAARRGPSAYYSASAAADDLTHLHTLYMRGVGANRVLANSANGLYVLDSSADPVLLSSTSTSWSRPGSVGDLAAFALDHFSLLFYGGAQDTILYSTGTADVSAGGATVTGHGTSWLAALSPGQIFRVAGDLAVIKTVDTDTQVTLASPWAGSTLLGTTYEVQDTLSYTFAALDGNVGRPYLAAASELLLFAVGNRVYFTPAGNPLGWDANAFHELPANSNIVGLESRGTEALVFTTRGVWLIENLYLDAVDDAGNIQRPVEQINKSVVLWDDFGIAAWDSSVLVPAIDDVYLFGADYGVRTISEGIRPLYRSYVRAGYQPGLASVHAGHYVLPILNGSTVVDELVCRLDRPFQTPSGRVFYPWTRWAGHAAGAAVAELVSESARSPKLLGLAGKRVTDLTGTFGGGVGPDADGTSSDYVLTTSDYPMGHRQGTAQKIRLRYEMLPLLPGVGGYWTADPWDAGNAALDFASGLIAGSVSASASRSWLNTAPQTGGKTAYTILRARPAANGAAVIYSALGFVQTPHTGTASGYEVRFRYEVAGDTVAIYRYDDGALTRILDPVALTRRLVLGDRLEMQVNGGSVYAVLNGDDVASVADATYFNAGEPAYLTMGIVDAVASGTRSAIRHGVVVAPVAVEYSSDQDDGLFTALTIGGTERGGDPGGVSNGSNYSWWRVGKRRQAIRFRVTVSGVASFVLRGLDVIFRPSGRQ